MFKRAIITTCIAVILTGCGAEDRAYDTYERSNEEINISSLDTESLWMYMPSTTETPRYAMTQRGFFQGDPKLVTLRFDKTNGIYVEEVDRDKVAAGSESRWDSDINRAPVLKIPGEFRQYRCAENSYGECTNKEEINQDENIDWKDATHFVPKYEDIKSLSEDTLSAWFTATNVDETAEPRLISYEYNPEDGVINVELERTFTASAEDQYQFGNDMRDLSFKTRFFYSLVKLDKLASKDYKPVYYQGQDSAYFGFFKDDKEIKTHTGESNVQGTGFTYLNRFNPNKESINYYLSDSYFDADVEEFRQLTIDTIEQVNDTLEGTGVPTIQIVNKTEKAGVKTGDLRYNVFNLLADPVDNGLLGYGPSATNPLTGEIIHAHVNQYLGVIRSTSRYFWNNLVTRYNRQEIAKLEPVVESSVAPVAEVNAAAVPATTASDVDAFNAMIAEDRGPAMDIPELSEAQISTVMKGEFTDVLPKADLNFKYDITNKDLAQQSFHKHEDLLKRFSEQNVYTVDHMWLSTQSKGLVKGIDYAGGDFFISAEQDALKAWDALTLEQQKLVSTAISKHMFKSTLIHELGHNLGLRHNFMGSVDKANFYTDAELSAKGVNEKPAAYSSIMDYGASIFDELLSYGKYDKAALRFGYARELETSALEVKTNAEGEAELDENGQEIPLRDATGAQKRAVFSLASYDQAMTTDYNTYPTGVISHLRSKSDGVAIPEFATYRYCTDEHTTTNLLCDRFDEGTNLTEVTKFRIQSYEDSYETMNRRNGRNSFYQYHQYNYFLSRWSQFQEIRDIIENVGDIDHSFARYIGAETTNNKGQVFEEIAEANCLDWRGNPLSMDGMSPSLHSICDTYNAANLAVDFFMDILTAPDLVCELEERTGVEGVPNRYRFAKLSDIWLTYQGGMPQDYDIPSSCFDPELATILAAQANEIVVRSQTRDGKIWSSLKANNPHQTSSSSVDLLGTWPDKLLAAQMLVRRDTPLVSTENSNLALIDLSDKITKLYQHLSDLAGRPEARQAIFVDADGEYVETVHRFMPALTDTIEATPSYLWPMKRYFSMGGSEAFTYWTDGAYQDTRVPYFRTLLANLNKYSRISEYGLSDSAKGLRDSIHINYANSSYSDEDGINFTWKGTKYSVGSRNTLAEALASRALYTTEQQERVAKLNKLPYRVRNALSVFKGARDLHEARIIAIGDKDALTALRDTTGFASWTIYDDQFVEYDEDGDKCLRYKKDGEDEEARLKRKCNSQSTLATVKGSSLGKFEDEEHEAIFNLAQIFGDQIADNNTSETNAAHKEVYGYDAEELRLWASGDYAGYRRAFEQFPIYDD